VTLFSLVKFKITRSHIQGKCQVHKQLKFLQGLSSGFWHCTSGNGFWHTEGSYYLNLRGRTDNSEWEIRSNKQVDRHDIGYHAFHIIQAGRANMFSWCACVMSLCLVWKCGGHSWLYAFSYYPLCETNNVHNT